MLALLGFVRDRPVHVLAVAEAQAVATERAEQAAELLAKHEHQVTPHGIHSHAEPADIICTQAATLGVSLIAMAASGHRPIYDLFVGSSHGAPAPPVPVPAVRAPLRRPGAPPPLHTPTPLDGPASAPTSAATPAEAGPPPVAEARGGRGGGRGPDQRKNSQVTRPNSGSRITPDQAM